MYAKKKAFFFQQLNFKIKTKLSECIFFLFFRNKRSSLYLLVSVTFTVLFQMKSYTLLHFFFALDIRSLFSFAPSLFHKETLLSTTMLKIKKSSESKAKNKIRRIINFFLKNFTCITKQTYFSFIFIFSH